jgi:hypothetical protein
MADANITELRPGRANDPTTVCAKNGEALSTVTARPPRAENAHVEKSNDFKPGVSVPSVREMPLTLLATALWRLAGAGEFQGKATAVIRDSLMAEAFNCFLCLAFFVLSFVSLVAFIEPPLHLAIGPKPLIPGSGWDCAVEV